MPPVPTNLLLAAPGADPAPAVAAIRRAAPPDARWAFLTPDPEPGRARPLPLACPCCVGAVAFRVALVDLLRRERPDRLAIVPPAGVHPDGTAKALREEAAAGLLALAAVLVALPADGRPVPGSLAALADLFVAPAGARPPPGLPAPVHVLDGQDARIPAELLDRRIRT